MAGEVYICGWAAAYHAVLPTGDAFYLGTSETVAKSKRIHDQGNEASKLVTHLVQQPRENKIGRQTIAALIIIM
jgi:hypothetical protein